MMVTPQVAKQREQSAAEARLAAAAPEILDLAKNIAGLDEHYIPDDKIIGEAIREWREQARTIIAKAEADAALIAAAPDMLAALRLIDEFAWSAMTADCEPARIGLTERIDAVRAAIAKAEGRT